MLYHANPALASGVIDVPEGTVDLKVLPTNARSAAGIAIVVIGGVAVAQSEGPSIVGGSTLDPIAMLAGLAFLAIVSGIAAYWPARRIGTEFIRLKE